MLACTAEGLRWERRMWDHLLEDSCSGPLGVPIPSHGIMDWHPCMIGYIWRKELQLRTYYDQKHVGVLCLWADVGGNMRYFKVHMCICCARSRPSLDKNFRTVLYRVYGAFRVIIMTTYVATILTCSYAKRIPSVPQCCAPQPLN